MQQVKENTSKRLIWFWIFLALAILFICCFFLYKYHSKETVKQNQESSESIEIPTKVLSNKFGWLGGGSSDDGFLISENGGAWTRPHPGAFLWDAMQETEDSQIDFTNTDKEVSNYQKNNLGILVTIWPFADWDQEKLSNAKECKVADNDEFLITNDKKGRGDYLPYYRCNPNSWELYNLWVEKIVERYDGDGVDDMPNLVMPIKHWEVMNEPDLNYQHNPPQEGPASLNFYKLGPLDYGELLKRTYIAIKNSDKEAEALIAGAAGADDKMLGFYKTIFSNMKDASSYFDIANIHCISNDQQTNDFNVLAYRNILQDAGIAKPIWVTEAEAMYGSSAEENFQNTKLSTTNAIKYGAEKIFFTRYAFDDFRKNMSEETSDSSYPSTEKYLELIDSIE